MQKVYNKNTILFFILPLVILLLAFRSSLHPYLADTQPEDSLLSAKYVDSLVKYRAYYPFIRYEKNFIEWYSPSAMNGFCSKVSKTATRKLKILHIGDSHIQADIPSGYIRERLQDILGYGGRGLVFPFKAAGTHAAYDYKTFYTGIWDYSRSIQKETKYDMGLIGASIHTSDSSSTFRLIFREGFIRENFNLIKIYCKQDSLSFDLKLKTSQTDTPVYIDCNDYSNNKPYVTVKLPLASDTLDFYINKTDGRQNFFECYGLMIESDDDKGVLYSSTGINGAGYKSLLRQNLFGAQLSEMMPDLVIIDLGANDFFAGYYNAVEMEANLVKIIDIIQNASPSSSIIISNAQDIYYRRSRNVVQCRDFMEMTNRVARYRNCGVYNYYTVSGGSTSMNKWLKRGLARNDKVHLSAAGYYIRGELMMNAMLNSYSLWLQGNTDSLLATDHIQDSVSLKKYFDEDISFQTENAKPEVQTVYREETYEPDGSNVIYYKIRSGDNLGSIAQKYGVSVSQLQYWNGLSGTKIIAGATLIIYKKSAGENNSNKQSAANTNTNTNQQNNSATIPNSGRVNSRKATYKVVSGDTLWSIAKKYNTTVEKIKQANNLKSDKLSIGQTLLIP